MHNLEKIAIIKKSYKLTEAKTIPALAYNTIIKQNKYLN